VLYKVLDICLNYLVRSAKFCELPPVEVGFGTLIVERVQIWGQAPCSDICSNSMLSTRQL